MTLKIAAYGIINKNDDIQPWLDSLSDVDYIIAVCSHGVGDKIPKHDNLIIHEIGLEPWKIDQARNIAISLIPNNVNICICIDSNERLFSGWKYTLDKLWENDTTRLFHTFVNTITKKRYMTCRIHTRYGYRWKRPILPDLISTIDEYISTGPELVIYGTDLDNIPINYKIKMLRHAYEEDTTDMKALFMLGKEIAKTVKKLEANPPEKVEAENLLKLFLQSTDTGWADERSETHLILSRLLAHEVLNRIRLSISESPYRREPWLELCNYYKKKNDWINLWAASMEALKIKEPIGSELENPAAWGELLGSYLMAAKVKILKS